MVVRPFYGHDSSHNSYSIAVSYQSNLDDSDSTAVADLEFLCYYALRNLVNLRRDFLLASLLEKYGNEYEDFLDLRTPQIAEFRGVQNQKHFVATLSGSKFILKANGYGFLGKGLGDDSPQSVLGLWRYLVQNRHPKDTLFRIASAVAMRRCAYAQRNNEVGVMNSHRVAIQIVDEVLIAVEKSTSGRQ